MGLQIQWILLFIMKFSFAESSTILRKVCLSSTEYPFARCNDGSSACYYTDADDVEDHKNSSVVIHLMSGGFSFDNITMQDRFSNDPFLTTSTLLPDNIFGTNLMSSDPATNPSFAEGFVHTFVPYCSSDLWLGSAQSISSNTLSNNINDTTTPPVGKLDVDFLGHYIVEAVLTEMIGSYLSPTPSITDSAAYSDGGGVVILSGASAGGIGVSNHIDLANTLVESLSPSNISNTSRVFSIIDSAWFPNYEGVLAQFDVSFVKADFAIPACGIFIRPIGQFSTKFPCCATMSCVQYDYLPSVLNNDNHVFLVQSLYDAYLFNLIVKNNPPTFGPEDAPPEAWILQSMSSLRTTSLISNSIYLEDSDADEESMVNTYVTSFQPACAQHIYMCQGMVDCGNFFLSSTYGGVYRAEFKASILSSNWNSVSIDGVRNLQESIADWFQFAATNSSYTRDGRFLSSVEKQEYVSHMSQSDSCSGLNCNPTCPGSFVLTAVVESWDWDSFQLSMTLLGGFSALLVILSLAVFISGNSVLPYKFIPTLNWLNKCKSTTADITGKDESAADNEPVSPRRGIGKRISVALNGPMLDRKASLSLAKKGLFNHSELNHMHEVNVKQLSQRGPSQDLDALEALQFDDSDRGGARQSSLDRVPLGIALGGEETKDSNNDESFISPPPKRPSRKIEPATTPSNQQPTNMSLEKELAAVLGGDEEVAAVALSSPQYDSMLQESGAKNKLLRQYSRKIHGQSERNETPSKKLRNSTDIFSPDAKGGGWQDSGAKVKRSNSTDESTTSKGMLAAPGSSHHHHHGLRWRRHSHIRDHHRTVVQLAEEKGLVANIDVVRLNYDIEIKSGAKKGQKKRLLHDVNVHFPACTLTAIMGSSGCGKSTLLDMMACRRHNGVASGGIFYGSKSASRDSSWLRHHCAYVLQLGEPWVGTLSVYDELMLAAALRLPVEMTYDERSARVHEVIKLVGLANHTNTKIGSNTSAGGLSGGQKRRFSIGLQMLKKPTLFFLDEPTSGLDAQSSLSVLNLLKNMTELGITILVTIHQPRREMWNNCFDNVLLMSQGRPAFYGPPQKSVAFFKNTFKSRVEIQRMMSVSQNPADVIIDILSNPSLSVFVLSAYALSDEYYNTYVQLMKSSNEDRNTKTHHKAITDNFYRYWVQVVTIWRRTFEAYGAIVRGFILGSIGASVIVGLMFLNNDTVMQSLAAYFMLHGCVAILAQSMILLPLSDEVSRFWIEYDDGAVSAVTFLLSTTLFYCLALGTAATLYQLTASVLITPSDMINVTDLYSSSLIMFVYATNIASVFSGFSILSQDIFQAQDCGVGFLCFSGLFGGFLVSEKFSPWFFSWLFQFCPAFYSLQAYFKTILLKNPYPCKYDSDLYCLNNSGEVALGSIYQTDYPLLTLCMISIALTFVAVTITVSLIKHKSKGRGHGGVLILHPHQSTFESENHEHDSNLFRVEESRLAPAEETNKKQNNSESKDQDTQVPAVIRRYMELEKLHANRELIPLSDELNEALPFSDVGDSIYTCQTNRANDLKKLRLKVFDVFLFHKQHGNKMPKLQKDVDMSLSPESFDNIRDRVLHEKAVHSNENIAATIISIHWRQQQARRAIKTICSEKLVWRFLEQIQVPGKSPLVLGAASNPVADLPPLTPKTKNKSDLV